MFIYLTKVLFKQGFCLFLMLFASVSFAQNTDFSKLEVYFYTTNDTIISNMKDNKKNMQFIVNGIRNDEEAAGFISVFKAFKGIYEMSISNPFTNKTREVVATCYSGYSLNNVIAVLYQAFKIPYVFVNNEKVETIRLEDLYK